MWIDLILNELTQFANPQSNLMVKYFLWNKYDLSTKMILVVMFMVKERCKNDGIGSNDHDIYFAKW